MRLNYQPFSLAFKYPFGVSSNTRKETPTVFLELELGGCIGYGEACLPAYLGETTKATVSFFERAKLLLERQETFPDLNTILAEIDDLAKGNNAAKAAIDIALHDLKGKLENRTVSELYGLEKSVPRITSFTIGIDVEDVLIKKIEEAGDFQLLKIKAGTENDKALISLIRRHTNKPLLVDVNQGWKDKQYVLDMIHWMKEQNVVLVEQPMPVDMRDDMRWVTERSPLPTLADESVKRLADLQELRGEFSGINIKLMKCTGLAEAMKMIACCKEKKLKVLLGCMAESSCATSAMAQLAGLADYIDLDAPLLYTNDPFSGLSYWQGRVQTASNAGIGAEPKDHDTLFNAV